MSDDQRMYNERIRRAQNVPIPYNPGSTATESPAPFILYQRELYEPVADSYNIIYVRVTDPTVWPGNNAEQDDVNVASKSE